MGRVGLTRAVARWILKEEPEHYSWPDLVRDGRTEWDGVHNALALRNLKAMRPGDQGIFYHTGGERACIGIVRVATEPRPDPHDDRGSWSVAIQPVRPLARPIPLAEIKADPGFAGFDLVRLGRLSVVPVTDAQWARLLRHETMGAAGGAVLTATRPGRGPAAGRAGRRAGARRRR